MTANLKQRMEDNWIYFASHVIDHVHFTKNQEYHRNNEFTKSEDVHQFLCTWKILQNS